MRIIVRILAIFFILSGISLIIRPDLLLDWIQGSLDSSGLYIAAIVGRFLIGLLLLLSAKYSRYPMVIKVLGGITMLAAVVFLLMGRAAFSDSIHGIIETLKDLAPLTAVFTIVVGGFLYFAYTEKKSLA